MIYNLIDYIAKENCLQETPEPNSQIFNVLKDIPIYLISNIKKLVDCIQFDFSSLVVFCLIAISCLIVFIITIWNIIKLFSKGSKDKISRRNSVSLTN